MTLNLRKKTQLSPRMLTLACLFNLAIPVLQAELCSWDIYYSSPYTEKPGVAKATYDTKTGLGTITDLDVDYHEWEAMQFNSFDPMPFSVYTLEKGGLLDNSGGGFMQPWDAIPEALEEYRKTHLVNNATNCEEAFPHQGVLWLNTEPAGDGSWDLSMVVFTAEDGSFEGDSWIDRNFLISNNEGHGLYSNPWSVE